MSEREDAIRECAEICREAAGYYDRGAGSFHSEEARRIGKAQAIWCAEEIERLLGTAKSAAPFTVEEFDKLASEADVRRSYFDETFAARRASIHRGSRINNI